MDDLISRSALLESLIHCDGLGRKSLEAVIKTINEQPIVYDVEQVVKELEERMEKAMSISEKSAELGKAYERHMLYQGGKGNGFDEAIEIVKGVGVNGTNCT